MVRSDQIDDVAERFSPDQATSSGRGPSIDVTHWSLYRKKTVPNFVEVFSSPSAKNPQGTYHRRIHSVDSPINQIQHNNDQYSFSDKSDSFLPLGLRQVALPKGPNGQFGLYRPDCQFLKPGRKTFSDLDVRKAVLDAPATRGPYVAECKFSASLENGLEFLAKNSSSSDANDTQSDTEELMIKHVFNPHEFRQSHLGVRSSARSYAGHSNGALVAVPHPIPTHSHHNFNYDPSAESANIYMQNKRHHHRHYFSNLDLFTTSSTYNYLKYAKADFTQDNSSKQPHLIVKSVGFERDERSLFDILMLRAPKYATLLDNISFELHGGETLAIMYTSTDEINALFSVMTTAHRVRGRCEGSFMVNGLPLRSKHLADRIAYVCAHDLCPNLTVKEQLRMSSGFVKPASQAFRSRSMISQLIQTLALGPVHDKLIENISWSEKQRVKIACQILLDTDFLLLDDITKHMDLYDSAFMIDYLRDWAMKLNRIVIMAINPPTSELLAMFHKTAIISSGRLIYFGGSDKMLSYFETVAYQCPLFKNPCDYYIDLVTHDYLTAEAALESSERITRLADHWAQTAPVPTDTNQIGMLPPKFQKTNPVFAIFWIYYRFWLILFNFPWPYLKECCFSFVVTFALGIIYYQLTIAKQGGINDRIGMIYAVSSLGILPNVFCNIERISTERQLIYQDSVHNLYPKLSFFLAKFCFELPLAIVIYTVYCTPVYFMAKLFALVNDQGLAFGVYFAVTVLNCIALRIVTWTFAYALPNKYHALLVTGILLCFMSLTTGVTVHPNNAWSVYGFCRNLIPNHWYNLLLSQYEFISNYTQLDAAAIGRVHNTPRPITTTLLFGCDTKEIKYGPILTTLPCPISTGDEAYKYFNLTMTSKLDQNYIHFYLSFLMILSFVAVFLFTSACLIHCNYVPSVKRRYKDLMN